MNFSDTLQIELIKGAIAMVLLGITWWIGQKVILFYDDQKKRHELSLNAAIEFQCLIGELKEISKIYRSLLAGKISSDQVKRESLLLRASATEGKIESLIFKIVSEQHLNVSEIRWLGLFRQSCQGVRESIRDGLPIPESSFGPHYLYFHHLAAGMGIMLDRVRDKRPFTSDEVLASWHGVISVRSSDYSLAVANYVAPQINHSDGNDNLPKGILPDSNS